MPPAPLDFAVDINDIPLSVATAAHRGTSHVPETRGAQEREEYVAVLRADFAALAKLADTDEKVQLLLVEFARYRDGYRSRKLALLAAKSRCVSTMIAGPAKFKVGRAQKRSDAADRRAQEMIEFRANALAAIAKKLRPEDGPIRLDDNDAAGLLRKKLAAAEEKQAQMKAANAAIRKHAKAGPDAQVAALVELGIPAGAARELLKPGFAGDIGFAPFQLTNNGAEIRRLKARLAEVEREGAREAMEPIIGRGWCIGERPDICRVAVSFDEKPPPEILDLLSGWNFSRRERAHLRLNNENGRAAARALATKLEAHFGAVAVVEEPSPVVSDVEHTPECMEARARERAAIEAWTKKWPGYCHDCHGRGCFNFPGGFDEPPSCDPCEECTCVGVCARCGEPGRPGDGRSDTSTGEGPCKVCGWNYDDCFPEPIDGPCPCQEAAWLEEGLDA